MRYSNQVNSTFKKLFITSYAKSNEGIITVTTELFEYQNLEKFINTIIQALTKDKKKSPTLQGRIKLQPNLQNSHETPIKKKWITRDFYNNWRFNLKILDDFQKN